MGISFEPELSEMDIVTYELRCEERPIGTALTYAEAKLEAEAHGLMCEEIGGMCISYGAEIVTITDVPEVHVSNANAHYLLGLLGLIDTDTEAPVPLMFSCDDMSGSCGAEDFLGRVLVAQGLGGHDVGRPAQDLSQKTGPTITDCGRNEGYGDERLEQLAEVARWAQREGRAVQWC